MEILEKLSFVNHLAQDLVRPRNFVYVDSPPQYQQYNDRFQPLEVKDAKSGRSIVTYICQGTGSACVVYLHGLSSFSGQAKYLSEYTSISDMSLCIFDFEGHGKSKGECVSYGLNQKSNLYSVLLQVVKRGYSDIVLWGRSMGAVTGLLFMQDDKYEKIARRYVRMLVLDSPFCSWTKVTEEIASKRTKMPQFLTDMIVKLVRNQVMKTHGIDLSMVDVTNCNDIAVPAVFVYSKEDDLVSWKHSDTIFKGYGGPKERVEITTSHNQQRSYDCVDGLFRRIRTVLEGFKQRDSARKGINIYSSRELQTTRLSIKLATEPTETEEQSKQQELSKQRFLSNLVYL